MIIMDTESADSELTWSVLWPEYIFVAIPDDHVVIFIPNPRWIGYQDITFTVTNHQGASVSETLRVIVTA